MSFTRLRLLSIATVAAIRSCLTSVPEPYGQYEYFFNAAVLSHYILSIFFSSAQIRHICQSPRSSWRSGILLIFTYIGARLNTPRVETFFGLHHVLSEVYSPAQRPEKGTEAWDGKLLWSRLALNSLTTTTVLSRNGFVPRGLADFTWPAAIISFFAFLFIILHPPGGWRAQKQKFTDLLAFETVGMLALMLSPSLYWTDFAFYHIVFWLYLPLLGPARFDRKRSRDYLWAFSGMLLVLCLFTPIFPFVGREAEAYWPAAVTYFGYYHFALTFVLSHRNPDWLIALFHPDGFPTRQKSVARG